MSLSIANSKNFLKNFKDYIADFTKKYNEGLFALVVALLTLGLERLLDKEVFNCPRTGYQAYGIAFFACPILMLALLNLLTMPAEDGVHIWSLFETCWVMPYRRRGDFFSGFLSALSVGLVAPAFWTFLALLDAQHLACWELGYQFGDNVTDSYLDGRGFGYLTTTRYNDKIDEAKAKSKTVAVIFLGAAVLILCFIVILRRSCLKPFDADDRLPSLCYFEKLEAFAARDELERLLSEGDEFDQFSSTASLLHFLVVKERIISLENELKEIQTNEKKTREVELEIAEFKELERVLHFWSEWYKLDKKNELKMIPDDETKSVTDAKTAYEGRRDRLTKKRTERMDAAEKIIEKCENPTEGEVSPVKTTEAIYQAWVLARLEQQKSFFNVEELLKRWGETKDEIKRLKQSVDSELDNSFIDSPEVRGRIVASYIVKLYKEQNEHCLTVEQVLELFRSIYPRVATSDPTMRYVEGENPMYKYIIDDEGETTSGEKVSVPLLHICVKPWQEQHNGQWETFLMRKHRHSWFWRISGCKKEHCPFKPHKLRSVVTMEDGQIPLLTAS